MENKINLLNHESAPSYIMAKKETSSSSDFFSSVTHPSDRARIKEDIYKRIRSGNDILCQIPTYIDPNVQFSDDDEEETQEEVKTEKSPEVVKTPEFVSKASNALGIRRGGMNFKTVDSTPWKPAPRQSFSTCKPSAFRSNIDIQCLLPQSENKASRFAKVIPDKSVKMNLMAQSEFKIPAETGARRKKLSTISDDEVIIVNGKCYSVLSLLGSGGSCKVFSAFDEQKNLIAVKCVKLKNTDPSIREGYRKEIEYLKKLQGSNRVIKMYDYEYREDELFLVLERGDIDFAKYISNEAKLKRLSPIMIKFYWQQMLEAVADIHKYGIVHSDLKPANFLLVEGNLKLIDFGIAALVPDDKTSTFRDTQVGTLNYMSPEAITQMSTPDAKQALFKVGVKSDVWSLGCILYNLVYGHTPFHNLKNLMQKINAIMNPSYEIVFQPLNDKNLVDVMKQCLKRNLKERASVEQLLRHPYLTEDKTSASNSQLMNVMEQMQVLTPRRMSYITKMVQELSANKEN
ncbi:dual specificity protein kinase TTK [Parasteatoda tepidariorum]|uniref:dual specificity protein kinase TTK n=1 Tax=Parasteatoda tepidariorum TaxID=114398 RepID=UPI00077F877A|nr:dual specificity protein kinase TTK [Parasteatoda tepidariorum]